MSFVFSVFDRGAGAEAPALVLVAVSVAVKLKNFVGRCIIHIHFNGELYGLPVSVAIIFSMSANKRANIFKWPKVKSVEPSGKFMFAGKFFNSHLINSVCVVV
jgi:hypothetical protein